MSPNLITPEEAEAFVCPIARTFGDKPVIEKCRSTACILWRWEEIMAGDARWKKAIATVVAETGEKPPFAKAAKSVAADPVAHDLVSTHGWCGLGGKA